jgi:hypothetical protein
VRKFFEKTLDFWLRLWYNKDTEREVIKMKFYHIYWGDNKISCFQLKSLKQAKSIAKQYPNVTKIEIKER